MIQVRDKDLAWMLLATVRYSLGRRSTAPAMASDLVKHYGRKIPIDDLSQIGKEIRLEIARAHADYARQYVGDKCDHAIWVALRDWVGDTVKSRVLDKAAEEWKDAPGPLPTFLKERKSK